MDDDASVSLDRLYKKSVKHRQDGTAGALSREHEAEQVRALLLYQGGLFGTEEQAVLPGKRFCEVLIFVYRALPSKPNYH